MEVFHEAGLIDTHDRAETHGHRRKLPEVGHQPRMRIRREAVTVDLLPKLAHLLFGDAALQKSACIDTRGGMSLNKYQVASVVFTGRTPKMIETHIIQGRRRGEAGDVAAELRADAVGTYHHRHGIPAY